MADHPETRRTPFEIRAHQNKARWPPGYDPERPSYNGTPLTDASAAENLLYQAVYQHVQRGGPAGELTLAQRGEFNFKLQACLDIFRDTLK
jgi:hypothetical protein